MIIIINYGQLILTTTTQLLFIQNKMVDGSYFNVAKKSTH